MRLAFFVTALLITTPAFCDIPETEISSCAAMTPDAARLQCFDGVAMSYGLAPITTNLKSDVADFGKWDVSSKTNPLDDTTTVALVLMAETGRNKWGDSIGLIARCLSDEVDVYITWGEYLGDNARPTIRLDEGKAAAQSWIMSSDSQTTFAPSGRVFLERLVDSHRLVAQITPYNESPRTAVFNLDGMQNAAAPLWEECGVSVPTTPRVSTTRTVTVKTGALLCETSDSYRAGLEIERNAPDRRTADYGPLCLLQDGSNRRFEQTRTEDDFVIVRRFNKNHFTQPSNIED